MRWLLDKLIPLTRCLPAWLRMPVIGDGIFGGWVAFPGPSPTAESEPGGPA